MKRVIILVMMMTNSLYGVVGFGLTGGINSISHSAGISPLLVDGNEIGSFSYDGFQNPISIGGYLYVDVLPIVDVDMELNIKIAPYYFTFENAIASQDSLDFYWTSLSFYMTLQKDLFKTSIPLLAKMRMFAGAGINSHTSTPMVNHDMLETIMAGDDGLNGTFDSEIMIDYLNENKIEVSGFHFQLGTQFQLFIF